MREKLYLERYWITIENDLDVGYGVTAYNEADAINILAKALNNKPSVKSIKIINSIDDLDANHVLPQIFDFTLRGIWYPLAYYMIK